MGPVTNSSSGLAYLIQPGGLLPKVPVTVSAPQTAFPGDILSLSRAAVQTEQLDHVFGISPADQSAGGLPAVTIGGFGNNISPGVSSADLFKATLPEQNAINDQALFLQHAQALFGEPIFTPSRILAVTG